MYVYLYTYKYNFYFHFESASETDWLRSQKTNKFVTKLR